MPTDFYQLQRGALPGANGAGREASSQTRNKALLLANQDTGHKCPGLRAHFSSSRSNDQKERPADHRGDMSGLSQQDHPEVVVATSGRSSCQTCGESIGKGEHRVGMVGRSSGVSCMKARRPPPRHPVSALTRPPSNPAPCGETPPHAPSRSRVSAAASVSGCTRSVSRSTCASSTRLRAARGATRTAMAL